MNNELTIKKCTDCGATVKVLEEKGCEVMCCGKPMKKLAPNSVDAAVEKHVPTYEKIGDEILAKVNHVMEEDHYIGWISLVAGDMEYTKKLQPGEAAEVKFPYIPGSTIYEYCNKHGLWKKDVE